MEEIKDLDFGKAPGLHELMDAYGSTGFQATELFRAAQLITRAMQDRKMLITPIKINASCQNFIGNKRINESEKKKIQVSPSKNIL